ncbi:unnamed protein product [Nesidiocoris tenuis]|uniref:Uncharacterized protein n=1 Tax=Nesidiocoris tenuis TaxID=355587 RepID=A0A6H5GSR4_9HEMI|nr:unnamed protein product [Nesidiocoris tenuis]
MRTGESAGRNGSAAAGIAIYRGSASLPVLFLGAQIPSTLGSKIKIPRFSAFKLCTQQFELSVIHCRSARRRISEGNNRPRSYSLNLGVMCYIVFHHNLLEYIHDLFKKFSPRFDSTIVKFDKLKTNAFLKHSLVRNSISCKSYRGLRRYYGIEESICFSSPPTSSAIRSAYPILQCQDRSCILGTTTITA